MFIRKLYSKYSLLFASLILASTSALAATDGVVGASSTGTVNINISTGDVVRISGLTDFNLGAWTSGDPTVDVGQDVCIYSNDPGGDYFVQAQTTNPGVSNEFRLADGGGSFIVYNVAWKDSTGGAFSTASYNFSGHNDISNNQDNGDESSITCSGSNTARLLIQIPSVNLAAAAAGAYSDTLTLVVTPN